MVCRKLEKKHQLNKGLIRSQMKRVAITGGIGVGKSSFCLTLTHYGHPVISADEEGKSALQTNSPVYSLIRQLFQLPAHQSVSTSYIAEKVFNNTQLKKDFENIMHPYIKQSILKKEKQIQQKGHSTIFYEIPLLFEQKLTNDFHFIILVICKKELQLKRVMNRFSLSQSQALRRIHSQMPEEEKIADSHIVIENNQSLDHLKKSAQRVLEKITKKGLIA